MNLAQTHVMTQGLRLLTMSSWMPPYRKTWQKINSVVSSAVGRPGTGMSHNNLEKQSMITMITVLFWDMGRSVIKLMAM